MDGAFDVVVHLEKARKLEDGSDRGKVMELGFVDAGGGVGADAEGDSHVGEAAFVDDHHRVRILSADSEFPTREVAFL